MKKIIFLLAVFAFALFSCSDDDKEISASTHDSHQLSGKVMSPNNEFPISRAKVKIFRNGELVAEQNTDAVGNFAIEKLPSGILQVELSKGHFKRMSTINLQSDYTLGETERNLNTFPRMAVVRGAYDEIEQVLVIIGVVDPATQQPAFDILSGSIEDIRMAASASIHHHGTSANRTMSLPANVDFNFEQLLHDPVLLAQYDIIFLNCGAKENFDSDAVAVANLKTFVENGGIVYATDFMYKYVRAMFEQSDYIHYATPEKSGLGGTITATIINADLVAWLISQGIDAEPTIEINGLIGGWQMADSFNSANVTNWLTADVNYSGTPYVGKSLAFTFPYGQGGLFYSSFHTQGEFESADPAVAALMQYFIFELSGLNTSNSY